MFISKGRKRFVKDFSHLPDHICWYIAGFIDGEGYMGLNRKKTFGKYWTVPYYYDPVLKILNTNKEVIDFLEEHLGGFRFLRTFKKENPKWKDAYSLEWKSGLQLLPMYKWLYPHLIVKKKICGLMIEFLEWKKSTGRKPKQGNRKYTQEEIKKMEEFYQRCLDINRKGQS